MRSANQRDQRTDAFSKCRFVSRCTCPLIFVFFSDLLRWIHQKDQMRHPSVDSIVRSCDFNAIVEAQRRWIELKFAPKTGLIDNVSVRSLNKIFRRKMTGNGRLPGSAENILGNNACEIVAYNS